VTNPEESAAETEDEYEEQVEEKERRHRTMQQRMRRLLKGFIGRYLREVRSRGFQEVAGYEIMAQNYIVFSHVLWRLFGKDWVEPAFVAAALLDTWETFWGDGEQVGYVATLDDEQRAHVDAWIRNHHSDAEMLAALYYSGRVADMERLDDLRMRLRNCSRTFFSHPPYEITCEIIEEMWLILAQALPLNPPPPTTVVDEWVGLCRRETRDGFCRELDKRYGFPIGSWRFDEVTVYRPSLGREARSDCLVLNVANAVLEEDMAVAIVREWMCFDTRDYYRISAPSTTQCSTLLYYDVRTGEGLYLYWAKSQGEDEHAIRLLTALSAVWDTSLAHIRTLAAHVDAAVGSPAGVQYIA